MNDRADADNPQHDWHIEITARIPGFIGYESKEQRRLADKSIRDTIVAKLDELRDILADVIEQANNVEISIVDDLSKILRTMNELRDRVDFLGYGDSPFFTDPDLETELLSQIYQLDTKIYDNLDELETLFESPKDLGRRDTLKSIRTLLDAISQDFSARREILKSPR